MVRFERARAVANPEYAVYLWLDGLRFTPCDIQAVTALLDRAKEHKKNGGRIPAMASPILGAGAQPGPFLKALTQYAYNQTSAELGIAAAQQAAELKSPELALFLGGIAGALVDASREKAAVGQYRKLAALYKSCGALDRAVAAVNSACRLTPNDYELKRLQTSLTAEEALARSRNSEGEFRVDLRNRPAQEQLQAQQKLLRTPEELAREIHEAKTLLQQEPENREAVRRYFEALKKRGSPADKEELKRVLLEARTRFNDDYYDLQLREFVAEDRAREIRRLERHIAPEDREGQERLARKREELLTFELQLLADRSRAAPTDMGVKLKLGRMLVEAGKCSDDAIVALQRVSTDPQYEKIGKLWLGRAFTLKGWYDEAVLVLEGALEKDGSGERDEVLPRELKARLADALYEKAKRGDQAAAEKGLGIIRQIIVEDITFEGILDRRKKFEQLIAGRTAGSAPQP